MTAGIFQALGLAPAVLLALPAPSGHSLCGCKDRCHSVSGGSTHMSYPGAHTCSGRLGGTSAASAESSPPFSFFPSLTLSFLPSVPPQPPGPLQIGSVGSPSQWRQGGVLCSMVPADSRGLSGSQAAVSPTSLWSLRSGAAGPGEMPVVGDPGQEDDPRISRNCVPVRAPLPQAALLDFVV